MKAGQLQPLCLPPNCFRAWSTPYEYEKKLCLSNYSYRVSPHDIKLCVIAGVFSFEERLEITIIQATCSPTCHISFTLTFILVLWLVVHIQ